MEHPNHRIRIILSKILPKFEKGLVIRTKDFRIIRFQNYEKILVILRKALLFGDQAHACWTLLSRTTAQPQKAA